jgi:O-antigen/teichoic acid export membrane protein
VTPQPEQAFSTDDRPVVTIARNVSSRWLAFAVEVVLGLVMLPFNLTHLGSAAYGLWVLTASVTVHFSVLNLGFGGALVKFVAQYRAHQRARAINEIASTLFFIFLGAGAVAYLVAALVAFNIGALFPLTAEEAATGRTLLLIIAVHVALNFPFSVYGGIVSGFQRYHVNSIIAIASTVLIAVVNVAILKAGYGLVTLVAVTTAVRVVFYFIYRANAFRIYPALQIRWSLVRRDRLREVTSFSVYALIIDWANKLNYQCDTLVIGAFLGTPPVAAYAAASRIFLATQTLTNQLNGVLFPLVVDSDASLRRHRLREILLQATRFSLVMVLPVAAALVILGDSVIRAWVGPQLAAATPVLQILSIAVAVRVGNGAGATLLKGAGCHRQLAWINLSAGIANIVLSVVFVLTYGLAGVAFATLLAVVATAAIVSPLACRRVGLPLWTFLKRAVLPPLWPALVTSAALYWTRHLSAGSRLIVVLAHGAIGGLLYLLIFGSLAIRRDERAAWLAKMRDVLAIARTDLLRMGARARAGRSAAA